ncbi:MAG TPA: YetF domain-containing protein [Acidimicrobiales bacterium]|nr:YetF domain-containing protein [Acidimicrobiales bacterium]
MEVIIRASIVFFVLFLIARGTGKRELSEMTVFELILMVTMGDMVQQGVTQEDMSITGAALAVATFAFWILVLSTITYRVKAARPLLDGVPVVVIHNGEPVAEALRLERITIDELKEGARNQGIADFGNVRLGVLEPDGRFSFLTDTPDDDHQQAPDDHKD